MERDYYSSEYDRPNYWVKNKIASKKMSWDEIYAKGNAQEFLDNQSEENDWPHFSVDEWHHYVNIRKKWAETIIKVEQFNWVSTVNAREPNGDMIPEDPKGSWMLYKNKLQRSGDFTPESIDLIEKACHRTLNSLNIEADQSNPTRGLVVGNVQSGKTANMAGLMAMAADRGWNCFIVLSGTIENLRVQTEDRLIEDLGKYEGSKHNWRVVSHPRKNSPNGDKLSNIAINKTTKLLMVSLKVKSRLEGIIDWLCADIKTANSKLKILIIDDEADQAGINTADISVGEKTAIHKLISNIVFGRGKKDEKLPVCPYSSMNYVCYTATPYGNLLNDFGELYPHSFIHTLAVGGGYFGPGDIFPTNDSGLDIVRKIPFSSEDGDLEEQTILLSLHNGDSEELPTSLKTAICWFFCCIAIRRYQGFVSPLTMLVHTSIKQDHHKNVATAIRKWVLSISKEEMVKLCEKAYEEETSRLTLDVFRTQKPDYPNEVIDYPSFDMIRDSLICLLSQNQNMAPIQLDEDGELTYHRGVHLCIDNCAKGIDGNVRLIYPKKKLSFAPAFLVVGGNTLSRGLTLKGLVCSWFIRTVHQADSLMQMGRWFGYRKEYELLPRVWVSSSTQRLFEALTDLDFDLRKQLKDLELGSLGPDDYEISFKKILEEKGFNLSSSKKLQSAVDVDFDYSGIETQITTFDISATKENEKLALDFLDSLGKCRESQFNKVSGHVWDNVSFQTIKEFFLMKYKYSSSCRVFSNKETLFEWIEAQEKYNFWNVAIVGKKSGDAWCFRSEGKEKSVFKVGRTFINESNIKVVTSKQDYLVDVTKEQLGETKWNEMLKAGDYFSRWKEYRNDANLGSVPLLVIYCVDRDWKNEKSNVISFGIVIPGERFSNKGYGTRLGLRRPIQIEGDAEVEV